MTTANRHSRSVNPRAPIDAAAVARLLAGFITVAAIAFSLLPNGLQWDADQGEVDAVGGTLFRQLQWFPLFVLAGLVVWWRRWEALRLLRAGNPYLSLFVLWATATMLWSPYPEVTFRKLWSLYGVILLALAFHVAGWSRERFATVFRSVLGILMIVSLLLVLFLPHIGTHYDGPHAGLWRGVRSHKNSLGAMAGLAMVFWLHAWLTLAVKPRTGLIMVGLALLLLAGAQSVTAALTATVVGSLLVLMLRPPLTGKHVVAACVLAAAVLVMAVGLVLFAAGDSLTLAHLLEPVANLLGRDITLTGRDELWALTLAQFRENWLLGYGYETFWLGHTGPSGQIIDMLYWIPWQAHNGYIDTLNETGVVGMLIVTAFLVRHFTGTLQLSRVDGDSAALHLALLTMILISNLSESSLFAGLSIDWIILAFSSMAVSRAVLNNKGRVQQVADLP